MTNFLLGVLLGNIIGIMWMLIYRIVDDVDKLSEELNKLEVDDNDVYRDEQL